MLTQPLYILQNLEEQKLTDDDVDDVLLHYDYYMRLSRAAWLKQWFGEFKIPRDLFVTVVDADITVEVLDRWYRHGGINCVYLRCKIIFNGGDDVNYRGIREIQEEIGKRKQGTGPIRGKAGTVDRAVAFDVWPYAG